LGFCVPLIQIGFSVGMPCFFWYAFIRRSNSV
jgi:hypothetical protein